ncbi:hypothetical protein PEC18_30110, partial [Paucibacter sp. O1-1]|nr:hypothetical protein [Paucibacter sp. O1-1]MDA3829975.1 hypothetical protein [Paucibacter sp. O1-1]
TESRGSVHDQDDEADQHHDRQGREQGRAVKRPRWHFRRADGCGRPRSVMKKVFVAKEAGQDRDANASRVEISSTYTVILICGSNNCWPLVDLQCPAQSRWIVPGYVACRYEGIEFVRRTNNQLSTNALESPTQNASEMATM